MKAQSPISNNAKALQLISYNSSLKNVLDEIAHLKQK